MGNALRKTRDGPVDGGATRTNVPPTTEYDAGAVEKLIMSKRLAPFYEGEPDASVEGNVSDTSLSGGEELKKEKRRLFRRSSKQRGHYEAQCFPRNINKTVCCNQALCTQCFVNLRRPPSGRTLSCPFCNRRDFSIRYCAPLLVLEEEAGISNISRPSPVKCEAIRAYRPTPPQAPPMFAQAAEQRPTEAVYLCCTMSRVGQCTFQIRSALPHMARPTAPSSQDKMQIGTEQRIRNRVHHIRRGIDLALHGTISRNVLISLATPI
ncbi:hypothetical protein PSACC_03007 [Paramicrosporidium saccamoebae]|uniref:RING-type domain-containing protein n=1 Tax=Paramicrosporidium saccamoebae TaxID=1246581 RepID=A0A2H9THF2_9FUNG|nr:hypothetical protein PSACC_03007 [Paramicrosporidium saccamoebae]